MEILPTGSLGECEGRLPVLIIILSLDVPSLKKWVVVFQASSVKVGA